MEYSLDIIPYILLALAVGFTLGFRQRKKMRKELLQKDEVIKLKDNEFNEFRLLAAGVTHEINNALTLIMARTTIMESLTNLYVFDN